MVVKVVFGVNRNVVLKNIDRVLRLLVRGRTYGGY